MKRWNREKKLTLGALVTLSLSALATGCGGASPPPTNVNTAPGPTVSATGCVVGTISLNGYCYAGTTFQQACTNAGGIVQTITGKEACRLNTHYVGGPYNTYGSTFTINGYNFFPRLTPNDPAGYGAWSTGIQVKAGDKVTMSASGSWGGVQTDDYSVLGIFDVTVGTLNCSLVSVNGVRNGSTVTHEGMIAGLLGSDGTQAYAFGSNATRTMANSGTFRFGMNVPQGAGSCATISISLLRVTHCEDSTGATLACP